MEKKIEEKKRLGVENGKKGGAIEGGERRFERLKEGEGWDKEK